jgi:CheY-like chemotaxis protein
LNPVVSGLEKMLRRLLGEDIALQTDLDPGLGRVKVDPGQIEQIIINLAVNARDAMPQGGQLTLETRNVELDEAYALAHPEARTGLHVRLTVRDTGCGMDAATRARIFEPFFTTKGEKGTGLGLATVYGVVKQSGGHITVESEVGHGTTFHIYLPRLTEAAPARRSQHAGPELPRGTEAVLLVEDEDEVRALTRLVLEGCGYRVLEARHGAEALQISERHPERIDLLLTDVVMPGLGGREVADRLTAQRPGLKVLFLSGYTDDSVVRHGVREDTVHFLQKPFTAVSLTRKMREVLDG